MDEQSKFSKQIRMGFKRVVEVGCGKIPCCFTTNIYHTNNKYFGDHYCMLVNAKLYTLTIGLA